MDESPYPLAQADHAYAYEGAYRTPHAMSAATREAYGMRGRREFASSNRFRVALSAAGAHAQRAGATLASRRVQASVPIPRQGSSPVRNVAMPVAAGGAHLAARVNARTQPRAQAPASFYYLFTSAAGCAVRAIVWRGRVFSGGKRA